MDLIRGNTERAAAVPAENREYMLCGGICIGAAVIGGALINEGLRQSETEIAKEIQDGILWIPVVGTGAALNNAAHAIGEGEYTNAAEDFADGLLNLGGTAGLVKGAPKLTKEIAKRAEKKRLGKYIDNKIEIPSKAREVLDYISKKNGARYPGNNGQGVWKNKKINYQREIIKSMI